MQHVLRSPLHDGIPAVWTAAGRTLASIAGNRVQNIGYFSVPFVLSLIPTIYQDVFSGGINEKKDVTFHTSFQPMYLPIIAAVMNVL